MRPRDLMVALGALGMLGAAGVLVLGASPDQPARAAELPGDPPDRDPLATTPNSGVVDPVVSGGMESTAMDGILRARTDTSGWTSGVILGDIQLAVSVLDQIQKITILVEECRNMVQSDGSVTRPWNRVVPVEMGIGTPTFEIRDVPFSTYGYTVRVHSPGLNGSQQTVNVTAEQPYCEVLLSITRGTPFSILLRDQDQLPVTDTDVFLVADGPPTGRPMRRGRTDNFGSLVFEDALAGDYHIFVGYLERPLAVPVDVNVQPGVQMVRGAIQAQGVTVTVPRGQPLDIQAVDVRNYGIEGVLVKVLATDKTRFSILEARTDYSGRVVFPYLPPGSYQVDLFMENYQRRSRSLTVKEGEPPVAETIRLVRIR